MTQFADYQFKPATKALIEKNHFIKPTEIQRMVIPSAMKHKDIIAISATGTGKTHAFLIPILENVDVTKDQVQAVISAPTRELALQLYYRAQEMCEVLEGLRIKLITGGKDKQRMSDELKRQPHIVIGTPGRMKDLFLEEKTLLLNTAQIFVVDEADMTLEYGFLEDIDQILSHLPKKIQMMSFSATIPEDLRTFLKKYMNQPTIIECKTDLDFNPRIEHILIPCKQRSYEEKLLEVLKGFTPYVCLIFANTRKEVAATAEFLREHGYDVLELHGDLSARQRKSAMRELANLKKSYVVASDIAARGIDIEGVSHVISLGFPKEIEFYIHRSGRTGRAGKSGTCYALYKESDYNAIRQLQSKGIEFKHKDIKAGQWKTLQPIFTRKRKKKEDPLDKEIAQIVAHNKHQKVKPGYKKKQREEIERLKRKRKREFIQNEIKKEKKQRAIEKQRAKRQGES